MEDKIIIYTLVESGEHYGLMIDCPVEGENTKRMMTLYAYTKETDMPIPFLIREECDEIFGEADRELGIEVEIIMDESEDYVGGSGHTGYPTYSLKPKITIKEGKQYIHIKKK